jgi:hypothetical protein
LTDIDLANAQLIGVGVRGALDHSPDHDAIGPGASILNVFYLKPSHSQGIGQFCWGELHIDVFVEPV